MNEKKLIEVKQVKLAVSIPNTTTQTLTDQNYQLLYDPDKAVLHVKKRSSEKEKESYIVHASNIAYIKI